MKHSWKGCISMKTRVLIFSDTHTDVAGMERVINESKGIDIILHLGDHARDAKRLSMLTQRNILAVLGNNDRFDEDAPEERVVEVNGFNIYMTHGHLVSASNRLEDLTKFAKEKGCSIALFGHSHVFESGIRNGVLYLNPGAVFRPRGDGIKSYAILTLEEGKAPLVERKRLS